MKLTPGDSREEREQYWIKIINAARRHPLGITAYLKSQGLEKDNYYQWFKKLRQAHPEWKDLTKDPKHRAMRVRSGSDAQLPKTEVAEKPRRRRFSSKEKARILDEIDRAAPGKVAAILRREGLYSSHIQKWRLERAEGSLEAKRRGPKLNPYAEENKKLRAQLAKSEKKLVRANALIEIQKKVAEILKTSLEENEDEE
jgi:transposase-like protein